MSDMARDAAVFEEWVEGSKLREIAAKHKIGVDVVLETIDKFVPLIDDNMRRRLVGREILRLEELYRCYFSKGKTDIAAAQLCLHLSRRSARRQEAAMRSRADLQVDAGGAKPLNCGLSIWGCGRLAPLGALACPETRHPLCRRMVGLRLSSDHALAPPRCQAVPLQPARGARYSGCVWGLNRAAFPCPSQRGHNTY
jgi:hypothetical protein